MNILSFCRNASLMVSLMLVVLTACATGSDLTDHAFSFDARVDSPEIEVLDYRYSTRMPSKWMYREGKIPQNDGINGGLRRGETLYVKWRIKSTGEVNEDTVDLRNLLPANITSHRIHFIIKGAQLYVYLISPEKLSPNPCPSRDELRRLGKSDAPSDKIFSMCCYRKVANIYPDQPKF